VSVLRRSGVALVAMAALSCTSGPPDDSNIARGRRLKPTALAPTTEAAVVNAAIRGAFDIDPSLVLKIHPRRLPRTAGYEGGDAVPSALLDELRRGGLVRGSCEPRHDAPRDTPRCPGPDAGYVVRVSEPFQGKGDTLQVNFAAEKFGAATGPKPEALRFEKIFQLRKESTSWRVVREARMREPR
jgi:hypothetical protein